jgi:hypothetical protein
MENPLHYFARLLRSPISLGNWLAAKLWDWGAILFVVAALWTFGGIGIGAAVAEPTPSAIEIAGAGMFIWLGGLLLLFRILHSAWKTTELASIFQRVTATAITIVTFAVLTLLGGSYLSSKVPLLSIDLSEAAHHLIGPPPESFPKPTRIPFKETQRITVALINVRVPAKAGDDATADMGISLIGSSAKTVLMGELTGTWDVYPDDPIKQTTAENVLWDMLNKHEKSAPPTPLVMPANNKTLSLPLVMKSVREDQLKVVNAGTSSYYFLCHVTDEKGANLLEVCFRADSKGNVVYCRVHNGP